MLVVLQRIPIVFLLCRGWAFARGHRGSMLFYFVLFAAAQAASLSEPYVIGQILNNVQSGLTHNGSAVWKSVSFYLLVYFALELSFWLFHGPGRVIERYVAFHIKANYKAHLFSLVTQLPLQWHREHHSGENIDKINRATNALSTFFDNSFEISYMLFRLIGAHIFLFCFMPYAGWVALGTTLVAFSVSALFDRYLYKQYDSLNRFENAVASAVHDYVTNIGSVITLRLQSRVIKEVDQRISVALPLFRKNITIHEIKWFINTLIIATMIVVILWHYTYNAVMVNAALLGGTFFTLFEYLRQIGESFYDFAALYGTVVRQAADVRGADTIVSAAPGMVAEHKSSLSPNWQAAEVSGLHFRYEDEQQRVHHLEDVTIQLKRGKSIALVGESGSGKSTLLSLLRGIQSAERVLVACDGKVLPEKLKHLNARTTLVPQDPEIFADTIRFNITFGMESDESEIMRTVRLARFDSVLERLPAGLDTNIAEKGVNLSGGEKQRLALARGIYFAQDSDIVLLDEPTSSVDAFNERIIYQNLLAEFANKCVVSSVHRLHLLEMFDYIYVLSNGKVVEHGEFASLLAGHGVLADLWACSHQHAQPAAETETLPA